MTTEPKTDKFIVTIKQNAVFVPGRERLTSWKLQPNERWVPESVVLDAYAQSQRGRNQQLQQVIEIWNTQPRVSPFCGSDAYDALKKQLIAVQDWFDIFNEKFEAFLKEGQK